jgi:hypothetical protein
MPIRQKERAANLRNLPLRRRRRLRPPISCPQWLRSRLPCLRFRRRRSPSVSDCRERRRRSLAPPPPGRAPDRPQLRRPAPPGRRIRPGRDWLGVRRRRPFPARAARTRVTRRQETPGKTPLSAANPGPMGDGTLVASSPRRQPVQPAPPASAPALLLKVENRGQILPWTRRPEPRLSPRSNPRLIKFRYHLALKVIQSRRPLLAWSVLNLPPCLTRRRPMALQPLRARCPRRLLQERTRLAPCRLRRRPRRTRSMRS